MYWNSFSGGENPRVEGVNVLLSQLELLLRGRQKLHSSKRLGGEPVVGDPSSVGENPRESVKGLDGGRDSMEISFTTSLRPFTYNSTDGLDSHRRGKPLHPSILKPTHLKIRMERKTGCVHKNSPWRTKDLDDTN